MNEFDCLSAAQQKAYVTVQKFDGNVAQAAKSLKRDPASFRRTYKRALARLDVDPAIGKGMDALGMSQIPNSGWIKQKDSNGAGWSYYFKNDLKESRADNKDVAEFFKEMFNNIPAIENVKEPSRDIIKDDCCTFYPIADQHIGVMNWGKETDEDYDLKIGVERLYVAANRLMEASPNSELGIILNLGDFFHMNDGDNMTPRGHNILDVDGRYFKIISAGVDITARIIDKALEKHKKVIYRALRGNHDKESYVALVIALNERYRNNERVEIDVSPSDFFFFEWGKNLIGAHHGDKGKADRLVGFMADHVAEAWGRTYWRYMWTGHIHHESAKDIFGAKWESFRTLAPRDSYSFSHGFTGRQSIQSITLSKEEGEIMRNKININPNRCMAGLLK